MEKHNRYYKSKFANRIAYIKTYGIFYIVKYGFHKVFAHLLHFIFNKFVKKEKFNYQSNLLEVFYNKYRITWANERMIEISIFKHIIDSSKNNSILEVGNVLSHYFDVSYDILDKYEIMENIINEDIVSFKPNKKYDLIISISTFEHIGYDEEKQEPEKILSVIKHLKSLLTENGKIIFSAPIAYNSNFDNFVFSKKIKLNQITYLNRSKKFNLWSIVNEGTAIKSKYGKPFYCANTVLIGTINNSTT